MNTNVGKPAVVTKYIGMGSGPMMMPGETPGRFLQPMVVAV